MRRASSLLSSFGAERPRGLARTARRFVACAVHCFIYFPGGGVSTGDLCSFFRDAFEFTRRPCSYCFYFGYRASGRYGHSKSYRIRSISDLGNEHDVV